MKARTSIGEAIVFAARREASEFLIVHRDPTLGSFWHAVSGRLEGSESFEAAAVRELLEETGFDASELIADCRSIDFTYAQRRTALLRKVVAVRCFLVNVPDEFEPTLDWEHDGYRWCSRDDSAELLHWPTVRAALLELTAPALVTRHPVL